MDNHPIPQDVTGFQFKLIGNMTVKQFAYIAAPVVLSVILFYSPLFFLIKYPLILLCIGVGILLAFIPFEGRPLDLLIMHFFRALFSPNQYIYSKQGGTLTVAHMQIVTTQQTPKPTLHNTAKSSGDKRAQLDMLLGNTTKVIQTPLDEKEARFASLLQQTATISLPTIQKTQSLPTTPQPQQSVPVLTLPTTEPTFTMTLTDNNKIPNNLPTVEKRVIANPYDNQLEKTQNPPVKVPDVVKPPEVNKPTIAEEKAVEQAHENTKIVTLEKQLAEFMLQKQQLEQELQKMKGQSPQNTLTKSTLEVKKEAPKIRAVPQPLAKKVGVPIMPQAPNLIAGIIKDPRGNVLPSILVDVKDKDGNAIRAFKTNPLGQFSSATQLPNGTYTLEFEDLKKQHWFDAVEITANGQLIMPLEIVSHDAREELRQSLFS